MAMVVSTIPAMAAASQTTAGLLSITGLLFATSVTAVWPGHVEYSLDILDGTDGFVVTAESSTGLLGYSVSAAGVSRLCSFDTRILQSDSGFSRGSQTLSRECSEVVLSFVEQEIAATLCR